MVYHTYNIFWLVVWNHGILFLHILGISSSQLTNSYFSEGWWKTTNQCSFDGCDLETLNIFEWEFMGCDGIIIDFFFCWWYECDVIGFYGISGRNVVVFFVCNFEPLSKMLAARNVMKCAARKDWHLAFGISRSNIYRFHDQTKDLMGFTMVIVNWEEWVRQSIT